VVVELSHGGLPHLTRH